MTLFRFRYLSPLLVLLCGFALNSFGQQPPEHVAEILAGRPDLSAPGIRGQVVSQMRSLEEERKTAAVERARDLDLPIRVEGPGNQVAELMDFRNDQPLYAITTNREAAISTAADTVRNNLEMDGEGFAVGVWDGGAVRGTHQEFTGRVNLIDNVSAITHATHVAGTIGAAGADQPAMGMSPAVIIDSYDWNSDKSEMTSRGASYPGEPGTIYISNHSYGYRSGWNQTDRWEWFGQGTNQDGVEPSFGRYDSFARDMDSVSHSLPYYLAFWAAGNDRNSNPTQGVTVRISGNLVSYDSAIHPPGDGVYKSGYDTIGFESLSKNVMTVGAVNDAVTFGERDLSKATMPTFSSWGPTDDGRIKPDIVANGVSVRSPTASTDSSYGTSRGTSMASPNAAGSAQLLASYFDELFPGHAMRASTLKALIVHTADDLGNPGPDYRFGWGLMNTEAAAEKIAAHKASPGSHRMVEAKLETDDTTTGAHSYTFTWDGVSPIRATLSWTDPAASTTTSHDNNASRLVNDLDLEIHGPDDSLHQPYVMPYVGDWTDSTLSAPATTGKNATDNVEQVFIESPPAAGTYTAVVTPDGALANDSQHYSLIISGGDDTQAAEPEITSISPETASSNLTTMTLHGSRFQMGANVSLRFPNEPDRKAFSHIVLPGRITARIDTNGMTGGAWDVVVTNPDGQETILPASFSVAAPFWTEDFEGDPTGWSSAADPGATDWSLTEASSRSSTHSYHASGPASSTVDNLYSPVIDIPEDASDLAFSFWHSHQFASNHGGVIEFSVDGGNWFDPASSGSGATFSSGNYNGSVSDKGRPDSRNALGGRSAWTGHKAAFSEVVVNLDASVYAGSQFQVRWRLGTNNESSSPGWYIDDLALQGAGSMAMPVPQITVAAYASASPVTGDSVDLHVEAENSDGSDGLTYTWTVNDSFDYPIGFDDNGTETANSTTATLSSSGSFNFKATVRNSFNQSASSEVDLDVVQTPTELHITPESATLPVEETVHFEALAVDQFKLPLDPQPVPEWEIDATAGSVTSEGVFTAGTEPGGPFVLTGSTPNLAGTAEVSVTESDFAVWQELHFSDDDLADSTISGDAADPDGDGVSNALEYALGGDPLKSDRAILPQTHLEESSETTEMIFSFTRPTDLPDVNYTVLSSPDLVNWTAVPTDDWEIDSGETSETITIRKLLSDIRRFLRLEVERN